VIGSRLARVRGGTSQGDFATRLGVHKNTYARWERDEREPSASDLAQLVRDGWNANWLLTGEGAERLNQVSESPAAYASQPLSGEALMVAIELAEERLRRRGEWLPKPRFFDLVALLYEGVTKGLPYAEIIDFDAPAAEKQAEERDDDSGQGMDESGAQRPKRGRAGAAER
jgi:transcriptional regulator with XRE-family HTH domain